jgi:translocation and assembly module TamB
MQQTSTDTSAPSKPGAEPGSGTMHRPRRVLRWLVRGVAVIFLLILVLLSSLSAVLSTHGGSHWLLARITTMLNSETQSFRYNTAEGTFLRGLNLYGVTWRSGENEVRIEQLHSRWNPMTLLEGEFNLESLRVAGLQVDWFSDPDATASDAPMVLDDVLERVLPLPIAIRLSNARLDGATINLNDAAYQINSLGFTASLQGRNLELQQLLFDAAPVAIRTDLQIHLQAPYALSADIRWRYDEVLLEGTETPRGRLQASGDLDQLQITHNLLGLTELETTGDIDLGLAGLLNARTDTMTLRVDLEHELTPQTIPGLENYSVQALTLRTQGTPNDLALFAAARLTISPTEDIRVETDLNLNARLRDSSLLIEELVLLTDSGRLAINGEVDWVDDLLVTLNYALQDNAPGSYMSNLADTISIEDLQSAGQLNFMRDTDSGNMQIDFSTDNLQATLNDHLIQGQGNFAFDGENWQIDTLNLNSGENRIELTALLEASDAINVNASIDAPTLSVFFPDLRGRLLADALISGTVSEPVINLNLSGTDIGLGGISIPVLAITGQNRGGMNEIELTANNIAIPVGETTESISRVMLRMRGQPDAHSMLLLVDSSLGALRINADGSASAVGWQGRLLSSEINSAYGNWQQNQSSALQISAEQISVDNLCWAMVDTRLCLQGALFDNNQLDARLSLENYPLTALNLEVSENTISRELGMQFHDNPASSEIRLPFSLPEDIAIKGFFSLDITARGELSALEQMNIDASAISDNGSFFVRTDALLDEDSELDGNQMPDLIINQFVWPDLAITAEQANGIWLMNSRLNFYQDDPESTVAAMRGSADANIRMDENRILNGEVLIDFDDLGWVEALTPQLTQISGELAGRITIQGALAEPVLGGDIMLSETAFQLPALGLSISGVEATISSDNTDEFVLTAYAESGSGSMNIASDITQPFSADRRINLRLAGSDFLLANLPELQVHVSPDLQLNASQQGINLTGRLLIPRVDAQITTLPETAVDVSSDTVLITQLEDQPAVRNAAQTEGDIFGDIPLSGEISVVLGDNVRVAGFGLNARLRGQLDINQRPAAAPLTYGELEIVDGSFQTYGRTLTIEQGKLLFMGSYDNPAIDIRAVREVENMRVGVQMNGTIRNIRSSLFSTPTLPDGDILAVMITGRPIAEIGTQQDGNALIGAVTSLGISQSQGITNQIQNQLGLDTFAINSSGDVNDSSLMIGKYLTPRIFIRYAVGLFETENSLAIDYTMTDRIKLQATSGQNQSIDITYTVEQ